jgi:hypothetical protein
VANYNNFNDNYAGIITAFQKVRKDAGESQKFYQPNYQGIIEAILDMNKSWSGTTPGDFPPGWNPVYDDEGNVIGGSWQPGYEPAQGNLWFDERQGRLMVYLDDAYYQANGADVLTKVQVSQPAPDVPGALWYNPDTNDLYIFDGTIWVLVSSTSVSTLTLPLSNPTEGGSEDARVLPDSSGLQTQADYNQWIFGALSALDENLGGNADVVISPTPPTEAEEGDLWYSSRDLELLIHYDSYWVPATLPLALDSDPNFLELVADFEDSNAAFTYQLDAVNTRITSLQNEELRSYDLSIDNELLGIKLTDDLGASETVPLGGTGGISVNDVNGVITVDGSSLETAIQNIFNDYTTAQQRSELNATDLIQSQRISALENASHVSVNEFTQLSTTVANLPTQADLATKLSTTGGELTGELQMNNFRIGDLGPALHANDAVRNTEFQSFKQEVASNYIPISNPVFNGLVVERDDMGVAGIKITGGAAGGCKAIEINTNRYTGTNATFGQTANPGEVAWQFGGDENFSWIHETTGKQLRIDKDEVVAAKLTIGLFSKDVNGNDVITNKIDVKEQLIALQTALQGVRSALSNSTSFEEFKTAVLTPLIGI